MNVGLFQPHGQDVPIENTFAAATLDALCWRIKVEPVVAYHGHRHQPVSPGFRQGDEEAGPVHAVDLCRELRAYPVGQKNGRKPVDGLALRVYRPAFRERDMLSDTRKAVSIFRGRPSSPRPWAAISDRWTNRSE